MTAARLYSFWWAKLSDVLHSHRPRRIRRRGISSPVPEQAPTLEYASPFLCLCLYPRVIGRQCTASWNERPGPEPEVHGQSQSQYPQPKIFHTGKSNADVCTVCIRRKRGGRCMRQGSVSRRPGPVGHRAHAPHPGSRAWGLPRVWENERERLRAGRKAKCNDMGP